MEISIAVLVLALVSGFVFALWKAPYCGNRFHRERGAVTVTYESPLSVQGTTVGPTAAQAANVVEVSANVIATADGDVAATLTHNYGLSAASIALGHPWVILEPLLSQALTALSAWTINTPKGANSVVLTKLASTGSGNAGAQLRVRAIRSSMVQQFPAA